MNRVVPWYDQSEDKGTIMADRKSLGLIGFILSGVTAVVIGVGVFVVYGHMSGRYMLDDSVRPVVSASLPTIIH